MWLDPGRKRKKILKETGLFPIKLIEYGGLRIEGHIRSQTDLPGAVMHQVTNAAHSVGADPK
jgi:hypothetical protein